MVFSDTCISLYPTSITIKMIRKALFLPVFILLSARATSQVIISLLLGDNLNTGKIEFGLDGGLNLSTQTGTEGGKKLSTFNLGFYFDIKLKDPSWMVHTGVIVKSRMGIANLAPYPLGDNNLDSSFKGGEVDRKLDYFNVPVMIKYKFKNNFYAETGPTFGLFYNSFDEFTNEVNEDDLIYKVERKKNYYLLDAGWTTGIGYRLSKGNGINVGVRYYLGFVDVSADGDATSVKNRSLYFAVGIPIGVKKARERAAKKEGEMNPGNP